MPTAALQHFDSHVCVEQLLPSFHHLCGPHLEHILMIERPSLLMEKKISLVCTDVIRFWYSHIVRFEATKSIAARCLRRNVVLRCERVRADFPSTRTYALSMSAMGTMHTSSMFSSPSASPSSSSFWDSDLERS